MYSRFPFIGSRDRLATMQREKSLWRRIIETLLRRVKIKSLMNYVTENIMGWNTAPSTEPNQLADKLIKVFADFRRPKPYQAVAGDYFRFLEGRLKIPNYLKERSEFLCAGYVVIFPAGVILETVPQPKGVPQLPLPPALVVP